MGHFGRNPIRISWLWFVLPALMCNYMGQGGLLIRDGVLALDYRAHPEAERFLRETCAEIAAETGLQVAAAHRVGRLEIGDSALIAAVAAPHRAEAFAACSRLVDLIKERVPIWKRQHLTDGVSEWVGL